jgi:predicted lipid-binding transport protein (Tim44 family)
MRSTRLHTLVALIALVAIAATLAFAAVEVDAAPRMNVGSRGSRTFLAPPPTAIERSMTQPGQPGASSVARPAAPAGPGGFFNRPGLLSGLAAGFLGAGLFGMLFGHGLLGGLGGIASLLGLILQIGIVTLVAMLVWRWWQRHSQPAAAFAGGPMFRGVGPKQRRMNFGGFGGSASSVSDIPVRIKPADFDAFERILGEVHAAYGAEDLGALRARMTPEMLSYYSEELAKNSSRGVINHISDVKLLQGDLAEAWREADDDYATVAMRYSIVEHTLDRASGSMIDGDTNPHEATELWTFRRTLGGQWVLSAVQQA